MNNTIKLIMAVILLMIINSSCESIDINMPEGWRVPTDNEAKQEWRGEDPFKYLFVKGDFNGDGNLDEARLLVNDKNKELGLFAIISQEDKTYKTILLKKTSINYIKSRGISLVVPGKYLTVCGLGIADCYPDEIVLNNEAINYFKTESAYGFYYWNKKMQQFNFVWISD